MDRIAVTREHDLCVTRPAMAPGASCSAKPREVDSSGDVENKNVGDAVRMYKGRGADGVSG